jgi:hypothetical protein
MVDERISNQKLAGNLLISGGKLISRENFKTFITISSLFAYNNKVLHDFHSMRHI